MSTASSGHWERVFSEKDEAEVSWFEARPTTSLTLIAGLGLGPDARVVDVGAGASRLVDGLLEMGVRAPLVLDVAQAALDKARARLGPRADEARWVVADVRSWTPDAMRDVWHDRAAFHFMVRPEDREAYGATLRKALNVGGHAIIATFASDGPERCSGLPVVRYDPEALAAELGPDFALVEARREAHVTPTGKVQSFQYSVLRRVR